jgi:plastocyanin
VVVGAWADCFRPETVTVRIGELVQWQPAEVEVDGVEIVLEDGSSLGRIRHVLEWRPTRAGTYRYHSNRSPSVQGTVVVNDSGG